MNTNELNGLIANTFNVPLAPYSTELSTAMHLVGHLLQTRKLNHNDYPLFAIERQTDSPFTTSDGSVLSWAVSLEEKSWCYFKDPAIGVCIAALRNFSEVSINEADVTVQ